MTLQNLDIKQLITSGNWSLFLDRDGVINKRIVDDYVKSPSEFIFIDGVLEAISVFTKIFHPIVVVTNQQGIGKGLMTNAELEIIHAKMKDDILTIGGKIDAIYYCPDLADSGSKNRKPEIGMALQAKSDFPQISFHKSIMVGDSISDMNFGKNAGMKTIYIGNSDIASAHKDIIDYNYASLIEFAKNLSLES